VNPSRIDPDTRGVLIAATVSAALIAAVSFALSAAGLVQVAAWAHVPWCLRWGAPVMIDGAIAVYTLAVLVFRARGESTVVAWVSLALWTAVSVGGNAAHGWEPPALVQRAVGTVVVALAPVAVVLAVHTISDLIVARPSKTEQPRTPGVPAQASGVTTTVAPLVAHDVVPLVPLDRDRAVRLVTARAAVPPAVAAPPATRRERSATRRRNADAERDARIEQLAAQGVPFRLIADEVGVSKSTVSRVLQRNTPTLEGVPA
jgi:hypothetical protein